MNDERAQAGARILSVKSEGARPLHGSGRRGPQLNECRWTVPRTKSGKASHLITFDMDVILTQDRNRFWHIYESKVETVWPDALEEGQIRKYRKLSN